MAQCTLQKPGAELDMWSWSVALDGNAGACQFALFRDNVLILSGFIEALDGSTTAELHQRRIGETPQDVAELHSAWQWALASCRELMLGLDGCVDWHPYPDPRRGMGEPAV